MAYLIDPPTSFDNMTTLRIYVRHNTGGALNPPGSGSWGSWTQTFMIPCLETSPFSSFTSGFYPGLMMQSTGGGSLGNLYWDYVTIEDATF
jgi:hypothetical protein